jgi:streptogramin lyase
MCAACLAAVLGTGAGVASAAPGDVYTADPFSEPGLIPAIVRVTPGGAQSRAAQAGNFNMQMHELAREQSGNLLLANGDDKVIRVNPANGNQQILAQAGNLTGGAVKGVAVAQNGDVYATDQTNKLVVRIDPANGNQTVVPSGTLLDGPVGIGIAPNGDMFVADRAGGVQPQEIVKFLAGGGSPVSLSPGGELTNVQGLTVGPDGAVYVADFDAQVIRVDPNNGAQTKYAEGGSLVNPQDVAFLANGDALVSDAAAFTNAGIIRVNAGTKAQTPFARDGMLQDPRGLAVEPTAAGGGGDTAVRAKISARRAQRALRGRALVVSVTCPDEACTVSATGKLSVPAVKASKTYRLKKVTRSVAAGKAVRLKVKLRSSAVRAARRALKARKKVTARVTVTVADQAGNRTSKKLRIRVRR